MKRRFRLTQSADFKRVRQFGKSYPHPLIVLVIVPNGLGNNRFAVIAGRTVGKAVKRNRAKRLIRAALDTIHPSLKTGWDILVIARRAMLGANLDQIQDTLRLLCYRAKLLEPYDKDAPVS